MLTAVFIDGGYLDKGLDRIGFARVDYLRLSAAMAGEERLLQTFYYHCQPYKFPNPDEKQLGTYTRRMAFFEGIQKLPKVTCRFGYLACRGNDENGKPILVQKKVDVMLAVDMVSLAARKAVSSIKLLSGDRDLTPSIQEVRGFGVRADLFSFDGITYAQELAGECDAHTIIDRDFIVGVQPERRAKCSGK